MDIVENLDEAQGRMPESVSDTLLAIGHAGAADPPSDVTAHQDDVARLHNLHAALQRTTRTIVQARDRDALFQAICRIVVEHGHFCLAWIGLIGAPGGRIDPVAGQGNARNMLHGLSLPINRYASAHCDVISTTMRTAAHQVVPDFLHDPQLTDHIDIALETGIRAMACFPLREAGTVVGVLNLYGDRPGCFGDAFVELLDGLATDVSFALDNLRRERDLLAAGRALRGSEEQFRQLAAHIPDVFWIADARDNRMLYLSPAFERIWGRPAVLADGNDFDWMDAVHPADQDRVRANYGGGPFAEFDEEYRVVRPDSSIRWVHARAFPVTDASGRVVRVAGIAQDITERRDYEARLRHLAHFDGLTGLPNRLLFHDRLKQTLGHVERFGGVVAVIFAGVDRFKQVNDTLGHAAGDMLLREVALRLSRVTRPIDTVARLTGDEFALMLSDLLSVEDAVPVAQQIEAAFLQPFDIEGNEIHVTLSLGIASFPADGANSDALLRNADIAMYRAKEVACGGFQFFSADLNARSLERLNLGNHLRGALERREFSLQYQPKADLATGTITGVEALLRWTSPELGVVVPARFLPILEESGQIVAVGEWMLDSACRQLGNWLDRGIPPVPVTVNLSGRQLLQKDLAAQIKSILDRHGVDVGMIELEVTESVLMQRSEPMALVLRKLKAMGIRLAIDDFGTGYSSLSQLKTFPLDTLKIDRSFIKDVITDGDAAQIARAVISMAGSLGLRVVAEGVDSQAQLAFLSTSGCDEMQGNFFAPPMDADDCTRMLVDQRKVDLPSAAANNGDRTLLLVDDETRILTSLKRVLRRDGYSILTAASAAEGLELMACNRVAVVVTDQRMPEMAGVEFLRHVKDHYPATIRIMLSGYTDFHSVTDAINHGAIYRYLSKPWDDRQLRDNISEAFRHHDVTVENESLLRASRASGGDMRGAMPPRIPDLPGVARHGDLMP